MLSNDYYVLGNDSLAADYDGKIITLRFLPEAQDDTAERVIQMLTESYLDQLFLAPSR